jgi:hypothetical protein
MTISNVCVHLVLWFFRMLSLERHMCSASCTYIQWLYYWQWVLELHWSTKILSHEEKCLLLVYIWKLNSNMFPEFLYHPHILRCITLCDRTRLQQPKNAVGSIMYYTFKYKAVKLFVSLASVSNWIIPLSCKDVTE